ncbi:membrane-bound inhibitor of C-type lysozyme [Xanthomonas arboricola]
MHTSSTLMLAVVLAAALASCTAGDRSADTAHATATDPPPIATAGPDDSPPPMATDASVTGPLPHASHPGPATPPPAPTQAPDTVAWRCGERAITTRFDPATDALRLTLDGRALTLLSAQAASGARFADAHGNQFWEHAGEATLSLAGGDAVKCVHEAATTIG